MRSFLLGCAGALLVVILAVPAGAQESLPAELYQLLEDARWLKEQGNVEKAREKMAEYDRLAEKWRASQQADAVLLSEEWILEATEWTANVPVVEGLDLAEKELNEGRHQEAAFRVISLQNRLMSGTELRRAKCLLGEISVAGSEEMKKLAVEWGDSCELGSRFWAASLTGPQSTGAAGARTEEVRVKLAEHLERVKVWKESQELRRKEPAPADVLTLVEWARTVDIEEALVGIESDLDEGRVGWARMRLLVLRERITEGVPLARAQCLLGKVTMMEASEQAAQELSASALGGPCGLGRFLWERSVARSEQAGAEGSTSPIVATVETRVVESNEIWQRWSWQATVRNQSDSAQEFSLEVRFVDADGFIIETDREYGILLGAGESRMVSGQQLISQPAAEQVVRAQAAVRLNG